MADPGGKSQRNGVRYVATDNARGRHAGVKKNEGGDPN
jgi:hypothetical protein